jgi:glycosyltransferase involved in cell wall biosynthesis
MKITMINDCAFVGETLIKYLPSHIDVVHLKRTRKFLDKTFKLTWKILRAKGEIYHCHYLLQDCWLALKFGKHPIVGHAHGSDLRDAIRSKKWGWMVKRNLKGCDKILVAQPTILDIAKEFNDTAEYFPIPYDPKLFYNAPFITRRKVRRVFMASPQDFRVKGSDKLLRALSLVRIPFKVVAIRYGKDVKRVEKLAGNLGLDVKFIGKVPHDTMNRLYWGSDIVLGSFGVGQLGTVAIEAMACGRPVVHHVRKEFYELCPLEEFTSVEELSMDIVRLLTDEKETEKRIQKQLQYVKANHSAPVLAKKLDKIYEKLT